MNFGQDILEFFRELKVKKKMLYKYGFTDKILSKSR